MVKNTNQTKNMSSEIVIATDATIRAKKPEAWCERIKETFSDPKVRAWIASVIYWRLCEVKDTDCSGLSEMMEDYSHDNEGTMGDLQKYLQQIGIKSTVALWFKRAETKRQKRKILV